MDGERLKLDVPVVAGLNLDQYAGLWAVDEGRFASMLSMVRTMNFAEHVAAVNGRDVSAVSQSDDGTVRVIDINGTLTKQGSSLSAAGSWFGFAKQYATRRAIPT